MQNDEVTEILVECDAEAAEAVSELFNRFNGGGYEYANEAGEATGGGAVIEITGLDDCGDPIQGEYRAVVKTYVKPGPGGREIRRKIEEGLWHLQQIYPIPDPIVRIMREEDWAHAWKKHYKPLRVGRRIVLKPSWETFVPDAGDLVIELDPGMAFGTGLHPSTRLCIAALEDLVQTGDAVLDVGTGSGVLSIVAAKLGASRIVATDIDPVAVDVARENFAINDLKQADQRSDAPDHIEFSIEVGSVPDASAGQFGVVVANILAGVLVKLLDGAYGNVPLAEPLAEGGHMVLAGIIDEQASVVVEAAGRHGLTVVDTLPESDWVALVLTHSQHARNAAPPH